MTTATLKIVGDTRRLQADLAKIPGATDKSAFQAAQKMVVQLERGAEKAGRAITREIDDGLNKTSKAAKKLSETFGGALGGVTSPLEGLVDVFGGGASKATLFAGGAIAVAAAVGALGSATLNTIRNVDELAGTLDHANQVALAPVLDRLRNQRDEIDKLSLAYTEFKLVAADTFGALIAGSASWATAYLQNINDAAAGYDEFERRHGKFSATMGYWFRSDSNTEMARLGRERRSSIEGSGGLTGEQMAGALGVPLPAQPESKESADARAAKAKAAEQAAAARRAEAARAAQDAARAQLSLEKMLDDAQLARLDGAARLTAEMERQLAVVWEQVAAGAQLETALQAELAIRESYEARKQALRDSEAAAERTVREAGLLAEKAYQAEILASRQAAAEQHKTIQQKEQQTALAIVNHAANFATGLLQLAQQQISQNTADTKAARMKQFKDMQGIMIATAIVQGAASAVQAYFSGGNPIAGAALAAASLIFTGAQIAVISGQKPRLHAGGQVYADEQPAVLRRGEVVVPAPVVRQSGGADAVRRGSATGGGVTQVIAQISIDGEMVERIADAVTRKAKARFTGRPASIGV